jgi:hypothetical protein
LVNRNAQHLEVALAQKSKELQMVAMRCVPARFDAVGGAEGYG